MQLVAYGAQDIYLTGNPQITFFKVIYRRHTNFSMESIEQTFNGQADFGKKVTCTISRNGDLIHRVYLQVELPDVSVQNGDTFRWLNWVGHIIVKNVEIEIGGQRIDKHYGDWLHIWNELTQTAGHQLGYANLVGNLPYLTTPVTATGSAQVVAGDVLYVPLEFWFCRNPGLALPLIALQYHEVKINLDLNAVTNCYHKTGSGATTVGSLNSCSLWVDYIYLDTDERRRFAQVSHEYLIEQLQYTGEETTSSTNYKVKLNFNHPTKELIFVAQPLNNVAQTVTGGPQWFNYSDSVDTTSMVVPFTGSNVFNTGVTDEASGSMPGVAAGGAGAVYLPVNFSIGKNPVSWAKLQLNGHDRFAGREGRYFNLVQPYQHHENVPVVGINVYSFALKPEEHQPSGTCNFSRIDNATLQLALTSAAVSAGSASVSIRVYAVNYNVLRIMSGMGGLAYSN